MAINNMTTQFNFNGSSNDKKPKNMSSINFGSGSGTSDETDPMVLGAPKNESVREFGGKYAPPRPRNDNEPIKKFESNPLALAYESWRHNQHPEAMDHVVNSARDIIGKGITTFSGVDSPLMRARAKSLVISAIKSYDPKSGANLNSWLMTNLKGLTRYRQQSSPIRVPERVQYELHHLNNTATELTDKLGREPTITELADETNLSPKRIDYIRKFNKPTKTESSFVDEEGGTYLPGVPDNSHENIWAEYVYHDLDPVNQKIYDMRVKNNMSVNDIADKLKMSASAVSQRANKISDLLNEGINLH